MSKRKILPGSVKAVLRKFYVVSVKIYGHFSSNARKFQRCLEIVSRKFCFVMRMENKSYKLPFFADFSYHYELLP